jgi:hypothetical protein
MSLETLPLLTAKEQAMPQYKLIGHQIEVAHQPRLNSHLIMLVGTMPMVVLLGYNTYRTLTSVSIQFFSFAPPLFLSLCLY